MKADVTQAETLEIVRLARDVHNSRSQEALDKLVEAAKALSGTAKAKRRATGSGEDNAA